MGNNLSGENGEGAAAAGANVRLASEPVIRNGRSDVSRVTWGNCGEADVVVGLQGATGSAVLRGNGDGTFNVVSIWCTELRRNGLFDGEQGSVGMRIPTARRFIFFAVEKKSAAHLASR